DAPNATRLVDGPLTMGVVCAGDQDWFRFSLSAEHRADLALWTDPSHDDVTVTIYESGGALVDTATVVDGAVHLEVENLETSFRQYVAVVSRSAAEPAPYTIGWTRTPVVPDACEGLDESDEPDDADSPRQLLLQTPFDGFICTLDVDYFEVALQPGCLNTVELSWEEDGDDLRLDAWEGHAFVR